MTALLIVILGLLCALRTMLYGVWTFRQNNFSGGIFVIILAAGVAFLSARYYFLA